MNSTYKQKVFSYFASFIVLQIYIIWAGRVLGQNFAHDWSLNEFQILLFQLVLLFIFTFLSNKVLKYLTIALIVTFPFTIFILGIGKISVIIASVLLIVGFRHLFDRLSPNLQKKLPWGVIIIAALIFYLTNVINIFYYIPGFLR